MNDAREPARPCVLVVDDEWLIRWSLGQVLSAAGYIVVEAQDAGEALGRLDGAPGLDAVLLDLKLPDQDGLCVLRGIKAALPDCPVIMMSAHGSPEDMREALEAGAHHFVSKPFQTEVVLELLADVLRTPR